jgi:hypothetical protein
MKLIASTLIVFLLTASNFVFAIQEKTEAEKIKLGAFVTSLYDINADKGTFSADFWIWTLSSEQANYKMNDSLEINYSSIQFPRIFSNQNTEILNQNTALQQKKVQSVFLHDFNLTKFPFDTQNLQISFEDGLLNSSLLEYQPDNTSGFDKAISVDGWKIKSVNLRQDLKLYDSNFGNFTAPSKQSYSRLVLDILIERDAPFIFFKLTMGLFLAVFVALCSCFMPTFSEDIFSGRMGLLGGTLLAVVVNQQFVDAKQGDTTAVTLIDMLHMLGMLTIMILLILTSISRFLSQKASISFSSVKLDRVTFVAMTSFFIGFSLFIVLGAL